MNENIVDEEEMPEQDMEHTTRLHILLHTKQYSTYSLFQHLLLHIFFLAMLLFIGFQESYDLVTQILARSALILYLLVILVSYLITKKRDILYMIITFIIEFPILVLLAYFDQIIALLTLSFLGILPWMYFLRPSSPCSAFKAVKKLSQENKSQKEFSLEKNS
ncbi:MAG: hypothetical protein KGD64_11330 [Candidatus Heimdallarchaeota archaeon]|nr:hypothetical protein [Candidatus Heimdallarchaeota archaeon]